MNNIDFLLFYNIIDDQLLNYFNVDYKETNFNHLFSKIDAKNDKVITFENLMTFLVLNKIKYLLETNKESNKTRKFYTESDAVNRKHGLKPLYDNRNNCIIKQSQLDFIP